MFVTTCVLQEYMQDARGTWTMRLKNAMYSSRVLLEKSVVWILARTKQADKTGHGTTILGANF